MSDVTWQELRDRRAAILERVAVGEPVAITVDGRAVATIEPINRRPRSLCERISRD